MAAGHSARRREAGSRRSGACRSHAGCARRAGAPVARAGPQHHRARSRPARNVPVAARARRSRVALPRLPRQAGSRAASRRVEAKAAGTSARSKHRLGRGTPRRRSALQLYAARSPHDVASRLPPLEPVIPATVTASRLERRLAESRSVPACRYSDVQADGYAVDSHFRSRYAVDAVAAPAQVDHARVDRAVGCPSRHARHAELRRRAVAIRACRVDEPDVGICIAIAQLAHAGVVGWLEIGDPKAPDSMSARNATRTPGDRRWWIQ